MTRFLLSLALLAVLISCEKVDELTQFEMEFTESFTIAAGTPLDIPLDILTPDINTNYLDVYDTYNTRADKIEDIQLREIDFTISSPEDGTFNFLESIKVSISTATKEEEDIASRMGIMNEDSDFLSLETSSINLKEYLSVDQFNLKMNINTDEVLTEDYEISVRSVFFVDARVLGQ